MEENFLNDINVILTAERSTSNSTQEQDNSTTSVLGVAVLGSMILGE